jgi:hypothetical protein
MKRTKKAVTEPSASDGNLLKDSEIRELLKDGVDRETYQHLRYSKVAPGITLKDYLEVLDHYKILSFEHGKIFGRSY